uniref:Uncharacterized protein n=1 Tax=Moniliophthora roreri TaxID=221103 RepID=A0A0W0G644_MONRR
MAQAELLTPLHLTAAASVMENLRLNTLEAQNVKIELVCKTVRIQASAKG